MEDDDSAIAQAQQVVMAKLGCDELKAGAYLLRRARIEKRSLAETATAVIARARSGDPGNDGDGYLATDVRAENGAIVIYVSGEIDLHTCERLRDAIEPHMGPTQMIVLDLSGVRFMDSSALHVLEQARGTLTADGGSLMLRNPSRAAHRLLTLARAEGLLIEERRDQGS
jgi:anti-anti-sigma factor